MSAEAWYLAGEVGGGVFLRVAILLAARRGVDGRRVPYGVEEHLLLLLPGGGAHFETEEVVEEVFLGGVLVEAADKIGDGGLEVVGGHDWGVEEESSGGVAHGGGLVVGHAFEHLDFDLRLEAVGGTQEEGVGDVEEVVRGDADVHGGGVFLRQGELHAALVVGVHVGLGDVGGDLPVLDRGLGGFHREVGALDDAHLDGRASGGDALFRPAGEVGEGAAGVGEVGVEHDARARSTL